MNIPTTDEHSYNWWVNS